MFCACGLLLTGENSQIPCFDKICGKLALFWKYLAIYHFFSTRVPQNQVLNSTQVQWTRVPSELPACQCWPGICVIKKIMWYSILLKLSFFIVLGCHIVEYLFFFFPLENFLLRKCWLVFCTTTMLTLSIYTTIYAICHSHPWHILTQWLSLFASSSCDRFVHQTKVAYFSKSLALSWNLSSQRKWQAFMAIFFDNSWRAFNASSCISSCMKLLEYHASF